MAPGDGGDWVTVQVLGHAPLVTDGIRKSAEGALVINTSSLSLSLSPFTGPGGGGGREEFVSSTQPDGFGNVFRPGSPWGARRQIAPCFRARTVPAQLRLPLPHGALRVNLLKELGTTWPLSVRVAECSSPHSPLATDRVPSLDCLALEGWPFQRSLPRPGPRGNPA